MFEKEATDVLDKQAHKYENSLKEVAKQQRACTTTELITITNKQTNKKEDHLWTCHDKTKITESGNHRKTSRKSEKGKTVIGKSCA